MSKYLDRHVRETLHGYIRKELQIEKEDTVIDELPVLQKSGRVDVAVIGDWLHCYEIKSESDKLSGLKGQVAMYSKVFDFLTLVADVKHMTDATRIVPANWGLLLWVPFSAVSSVPQIVDLREARLNMDVSKDAVVKLLWKAQALDLLKSVDAHKGLSATPKYKLWPLVAEACSLMQIREALRLQYLAHKRVNKHGY